MSNKSIVNAASARFPNSELCRVGFAAGAEWQIQQDAARGPRSVSGVGDAPATGFLSSVETMDEAKAQVLPDQAGGIRVEWIKGQPCFIGFGDAHAINTLIASIRDQKMDVAKAALNSDCVTDGGVMRMLSSIENRLMEISSHMNGQHNSQIAAHVETHGLIQKAESEGVMRIGVDLATGSDETHIAIRQPNGKFIPLEELSDELLDMIKDQMPVSQYVAEMARRKQVSQIMKDERDVKIEELQAKASTLENRLHFYRLLAKSRQAALNAVYGALDSFED